MNIALIAHGGTPIPPNGHGAVESILWWLKQHLELLGHRVDIANTRAIHEVIHEANRRRPDFVHVHNELFVLECVAHLRRPFAVTSHHGQLHRFDPDDAGASRGLWYLFEDTLRAPANIVLSERIRQLYLRRGYPHFLRVLRNGVETEQFRLAPQGNGKAVCLGQISARKRQDRLAEVARHGVAVDFIGPWNRGDATGFSAHDTARYVGAWDKTTLYERLSDYSCLALLSESEASPKVTLEALAAGLSIVITEACAANLAPQPFITIIPDAEARPEVIAEAIRSAIDANPRHRSDARQYAWERFDYSVVAREYVPIMEEAIEYFHGSRAMIAHDRALLCEP